jgi:predicted kinase
MSTTHLISGLPCSGKTTYALGLKADLDSVVFSLDRWLITAFGRYSIAEIGHDEHVRRVLATRELIWSAASELLRRGTDVILDDGFFLRANRMQFVQLAKRQGAAAKTHYIDTPRAVLLDRLAARNANLPPFNFAITPETMEAFFQLYETPSEDEGAQVIVVSDPRIPESVRDSP